MIEYSSREACKVLANDVKKLKNKGLANLFYMYTTPFESKVKSLEEFNDIVNFKQVPLSIKNFLVSKDHMINAYLNFFVMILDNCLVNLDKVKDSYIENLKVSLEPVLTDCELEFNSLINMLQLIYNSQIINKF